MTLDAALAALSDERFVSLTTFRKTGEGVSTPVWIARDGDALIVTTPDGTGKVKRIRNNGRVELRPCDRMGKVADGAPTVAGTAEIVDTDEARDSQARIFVAKYKLEYRIFMVIERLGKKGQKKRVCLRITA
ncbi:PPOX class F420-dependent oxidoreductase [Agreia sp. COWG]|uniref:PPOX class F420-dependent oxidoreductase n=1 Tax=Agreia sp. COWG TaxID=2773266 RepID=UPI001927D7FE|nr:PPOX class F420-dependent oxidoreductase [Agreia sp. COWG]CAD5989393.1 Putative_PNPOx domain-containing protein [Agreia sp. COWG]